MRIYGCLQVPSFAAIWLTALCAFVGCGGGVSITVGHDAGPNQADSATDRSTTPTEDRPPVQQPDASVPNDASDDASTPPPDAVTPVTDTPDAGTDASTPEDHPLVWCGATFPEPGETCHRELPPGMPMGDFTEVGTGVCSPATVTLMSGPSRLNCLADDRGVTYMDIRSISPGTGFAPCIGRICVVYMGPSMPIRGVQWDPVSRTGAAVIWAPGQSVNTPPMDDPMGSAVLY